MEITLEEARIIANAITSLWEEYGPLNEPEAIFLLRLAYEFPKLGFEFEAVIESTRAEVARNKRWLETHGEKDL